MTSRCLFESAQACQGEVVMARMTALTGWWVWCKCCVPMLTKLSTAAVLTAVAVALGYLLFGIPNVEGLSVVSFVAGCLLGYGTGVVVGGVSTLIFSVFNPLGPAPPPVLLGQVLGRAMIGASGHVWRGLAQSFPRPEILASGFGAILTLLYGVLSDYGSAVSMGRWNHPVPVIVAGIPFYAVHIVSNTLIFGGVGAYLVRKDKVQARRRKP
jgi:hypothetical protein